MAKFDFDALKKKAAEAAETVANKSAAIAKNVAEKSGELAKKAKLATEIAAEKDQLRKGYNALGKLYYEKYGENADPDFCQAVAEIKLSLDKIDAKQAEIDALKDDDDDDIEVEIVEETAEEECCCEKEEETCDCEKNDDAE